MVPGRVSLCMFTVGAVAIAAVRGARADNVCAKPLIDKIACCTWGVTNQLNSVSESYYPVYREFAANVGAKVQDDLTTAQAKSVLDKAKAFASGAHARLPFVEPFDPDREERRVGKECRSRW